MAEATNKSRHGRRRGGRARGQMAGGMLASLAETSAKPKPAASQHSAAHAGTSSSLMNLDKHQSNVDQSRVNLNKAPAGQKRVPLKDAAINNRVERHDVQLKAKIPSLRRNGNGNEHQIKLNVAPKTSAIAPAAKPSAPPAATTDEIVSTPRNNNPDNVMSPSSNLSSVADSDDTLTPPPLTSVKMKNNQLEITLLSPISFDGLSLSTPSSSAKLKARKVTHVDGKVLDREHDNDDDEEDSYVQSKNDSIEESLEQSSNKDESTMSNESSNNSDEDSERESHSNNSSITNEEISANPRIVINRKIAKNFYGKAYVGTIVGYDDSDHPAFWQVEYVDGDGEDFSYAELMSGMQYFEELVKDGVIPSNDECNINTSYEQDEDANERDDEDCFSDEETDDDEDYSIEQESDSEDELEIDEGVDSDRKNDKCRGKKNRTKPATKSQIKADTLTVETHSDVHSSEGEVCSLNECRVNLSARIENDDEMEDLAAAFDVEITESSHDNETNSSEETKDSDPVAVEVQSEDGESIDNDCFEDEVVADFDVAGITSVPGVSTEIEDSISNVETAKIENEVADAGKSESAEEIQKECYVAEATVQLEDLNLASDEMNAASSDGQKATIGQEKTVLEKDVVEDTTIGSHEPTAENLFSVVDRIFLESDADTVTVKDVKNSVASHFGLQKVKKEMKQAIKNRLIDLIQGKAQPMGATEELGTDGDGIEEYDQDAESHDASQNDDNNNAQCDESRSIASVEVAYASGSESPLLCDASHDTSNSPADLDSAPVTSGNVCDRTSMSETLFQNLSPEFSIHSRTDGNDSEVNALTTINPVSSPVIAAEPKSRSAVVKGKWNLGPEIGVGSFGRVHTGLNAVNGSIMAVKVLNIPNDNKQSVIEEFQREIDVMKTLNHPNIVRYLGAEVDSSRNTLSIFQEWVPGGSVSSLLKRFGPFSVDIVKTYVQQVLKGLDYLHSHGIIHRDIKGGNILVSNDGSIKVADFGASKKIEALGADSDDSMEMTMRGTPYFMALEVFDGTYGRRADIWSVGGVIYQMVTGLPPWKSLGFKNPVALIRHITAHSGPPELPTLKNCDRHELTLLKNILSRCFDRDPANRPFASELLQDAFFGTNENNNLPPPSPTLPLLSPSTRSPLHRIVEDQELDATLSESLCYSLKQVPEDDSSEASSDSLCYSLTLTSPLKLNETKTNSVIDSSAWPEWAKNRHAQNISAGKENATTTSKAKGKNPFAKKKPLANLHANTTYSSGAK